MSIVYTGYWLYNSEAERLGQGKALRSPHKNILSDDEVLALVNRTINESRTGKKASTAESCEDQSTIGQVNNPASDN